MQLVDTHKFEEKRNIPLDRVGITDLKLPIVLNSGNRVYNGIAGVSVYVGLAGALKGAHLSRISEVLNSSIPCGIELGGFGKLVEDLSATCEADNVELHLEVEIPYESLTPVTNKKSICIARLRVFAERCDGKTTQNVDVVVEGTALCPCSKNISIYSAHNQRSEMTLTVYDCSDIDINATINQMIKEFSCEVYNCLKREDEKFVTERAYENAKFSEDIVRDALIALKKLYPTNRIKIKVKNYESIHQHNVEAMGYLG